MLKEPRGESKAGPRTMTNLRCVHKRKIKSKKPLSSTQDEHHSTIALARLTFGVLQRNYKWTGALTIYNEGLKCRQKFLGVYIEESILEGRVKVLQYVLVSAEISNQRSFPLSFELVGFAPVDHYALVNGVLSRPWQKRSDNNKGRCQIPTGIRRCAGRRAC
jgi:hypothetical protein